MCKLLYNTADILLLVRPDYTIFDEVRRREDFGTFADLRLTGVGMVASEPLTIPSLGLSSWLPPGGFCSNC